jgi:hypothetical protein
MSNPKGFIIIPNVKGRSIKISGRIYGKAFKKSRIFSQIKSALAILRNTIYNKLK